MSAVILFSLFDGARPLPDISSFIPLNIQVSSSATVTFLGAQFGGSDLSPSAYIAGQLCQTTTWTQATSLLCTVAAPYITNSTAPTLFGNRLYLCFSHEMTLCSSRS
jgi:hypothetical protein